MFRGLVLAGALIVALATVLSTDRPFAQTKEVFYLDESKSRAFHTLGKPQLRRFESNAEAQEIVDLVVRFVPMPYPIKAFVTDDPHNVPNAVARFSPAGERIIGFNRTFMQQVLKESATYWSMVGIAAHEVGHHAQRHSLDLDFDNCKKNNLYELEADFWAGFALAKLGVKQQDATETLRALPPGGTCDHPPYNARAQKLTQGWSQAQTGQVASAAASIDAGGAIPSAAASALAGFKLRKNRDVYGHDIAKLPGISEAMCALKCKEDGRCKGFSYDRWHAWCFLKDAMPISVLDAASVIAVPVSAAFPNVSTSTTIMHKIRNRRYSDDSAFVSKTLPTFEACLESCESELKCVAFNYVKTQSSCQFFSSASGHYFDTTSDGGFKRQLPPDAVAPAATTAAVSMRLERGKYFKGDGYSPHADVSIGDCEGLCRKDARCVAIEYITRERKCRLYDKLEASFATDGTTVGYKQSN